MGKRIGTSLLFALGVLVVTLPASAQVRDRYRGRPVAEVLRELQSEGARIIFTTALVAPALRVTVEPRAARPVEIAREVLIPHGLGLRAGPRQTWLVIRIAAADAPRGEKDTRATGSPDQQKAPSSEDEPYRIEEHVEVVDRVADVAQNPGVVRIESARALDTAGTLDNMLQVLPALPGVAGIGDEENGISVRGGGPEHNVILFDGVQVHSPQRLGDFGASFVNPSVTDSIALDASGLDAGHGGRLSSVTVLETRNGALDRRLALSGSVGLTSGDLLAEGRLPRTDSGSWWVAARGTYYKFVADRLRDAGVPGFADLQFKVNLRPTARTELSVLGLAGQESLVFRVNGDPDPQMPEGNIAREIDVDNRLGVANLRWTPRSGLTTLTTLTGYSTIDRRRNHASWGPFDRAVRVSDLAVRQRVSLAWSPRQLVDAGLEARHVATAWRMQGKAHAPFLRPLGPDTFGGLIEYDGPIDSRLEKSMLGAWLQNRVRLAPGLAVQPGVRLDWNSLTGEAAWQPRIRLTKQIGNSVLWTGIAWQAQTPGHETMQQGHSYYDFSGSEAESLRNERSRQLVVGLDWEIGRGTAVRVEAYRRTFERLLVQRRETDAERAHRLEVYLLPADMPPDSAILDYRPTVHPESTGTGRAAGLEILVQQTRGRLTGWLAYTLSRSERELYDRTVPFDFDRTHSLAVAMNLRIASRVLLSTTSQYGSGFPLTPVHPEVHFSGEGRAFQNPPFRPGRMSNGQLLMMKDPTHPLRVTLLNSTRMPPYARTDVRVTVTVTRWLEAYGEILNLTDRGNFQPPIDGILDGRKVTYGVSSSLPRLPTYGVRVKF